MACSLSLVGCEKPPPPEPEPAPAPQPAPKPKPPPVVEAADLDAGAASVDAGDEAKDAGGPTADAGETDGATEAPDASTAEPVAEDAVDAGPGPRVLQVNGKPALFVWSTAESAEAAQAQLAEFERMRAPWPELDGLSIAPTYPRIVALGEEHLVVLGTCGPDTEATVDRALALARLGRPGVELRAVEHPLGNASFCPRASGDVVVLPETPLGKQTLAAAVVKRHPFGLPGPELNQTWDSLTLAVLREQDSDGGVPGAIVTSAMKDVRRCADPVGTAKKGALVVVQQCIAADCDEAAAVAYATTTTTWTVKGKKLVSASKSVRRAGRRCDTEDNVVDP